MSDLLQILGNQEQMKTFKQLGMCENLLHTCEKMGIKYPSKIQSESMQCTGRDLIGIAPSSAGKTVAFVLLILQALLKSLQPIFACVLSRSREDVAKIAYLFEALKPFEKIQTKKLVVGTNVNQQALFVAGAPTILVGTPDRVWELLTLTPITKLPSLKYLIIVTCEHQHRCVRARYKGYIRRASKTALAWRSARVISLVDDNDLNKFRKIEIKMDNVVPEFPSREDEVLTSLERVTQARKKSLQEITECRLTKRKRGIDDEKERKKQNSEVLPNIT